jgi:hypothetical protein
MMRWFFALTASLALVASGLVHGFWTDRWQAPPETQEAALRLDRLPLELGDWRGQSEEVKPGQAGQGVAGCIQRSYVNDKTGAIVVLALVCGRPGPVSIHSPEVCYVASGYSFGSRSRVRVSDGEPAQELWTADALRTNATEEKRERLFWGWNGGQGWSAADDPRIQFARRPVLHKIYVKRELVDNERPREEPCQEFLRVLLPVLDQTLFAQGS